MEVPIIDVSLLQQADAEAEALQQLAERLGEAAEAIGFIVITHHGVDEAILQRAWAATEAFFDQDEAQKLLAATEDEQSYPYGYSRLEGEVLSRTRGENGVRGDLKEMFSIGPKDSRSGMPPRRWPKSPPHFRQAWEAYYDEMLALAHRLLRGLALALRLQPDFFRENMGRHQCALRALNYPDLEGVKPAPGQLRASAHTDYGVVTILKSGGPGLQVAKDRGNPQWIDVPHVEGAFVINLGDLMRRWTNNRWASTLHRVIVPPEGSGWGRRQSMAFFVNINGDAEVRVIDGTGKPKYEPITAVDFLLKRHLTAMGALDQAQAQAQPTDGAAADPVAASVEEEKAAEPQKPLEEEAASAEDVKEAEAEMQLEEEEGVEVEVEVEGAGKDSLLLRISRLCC
eukprot:scaffold3951_cov258-Pinguiococcus_pyrenoidosus.AAC.9